jgi:hypothetical protein
MAKTPLAQLKREIAEALAQQAPSTIKLKDRSRGHVWLTIRDGRVVGVVGSDPSRYMGMTRDEARHLASYGGRGRDSHATVKHDRDEARMFGRYARRMEQTKAQALANARAEGFAAHQLGTVEEGWEAEGLDTIHGGFAGSSHATQRQVELDTGVYRRTHGAEPRGTANWTFVIGKREYAYSDDSALYQPAESRGVYKKGRPEMPFARAKEYAIAEAKRRGATIVGVAP